MTWMLRHQADDFFFEKLFEIVCTNKKNRNFSEVSLFTFYGRLNPLNNPVWMTNTASTWAFCVEFNCFSNNHSSAVKSTEQKWRRLGQVKFLLSRCQRRWKSWEHKLNSSHFLLNLFCFGDINEGHGRAQTLPASGKYWENIGHKINIVCRCFCTIFVEHVLCAPPPKSCWKQQRRNIFKWDTNCS